MAFTTVFVPYCSVDGCGLLILPCVDGFHDGLHPVFLVVSLAGTIILLLVRDFANCLHAVWLNGK